MGPKEANYKYYSDAEWETIWITEHGRHSVHLGTGSHLVCSTCLTVLNVTTRSPVELFESLAGS